MDADRTIDLLNAWRDAVQAADLADRLSAEAIAAGGIAQVRADVAAEIAQLARNAASAAARAADRAEEASAVADAEATRFRNETMPAAADKAVDTRAVAEQTGASYREAAGADAIEG